MWATLKTISAAGIVLLGGIVSLKAQSADESFKDEELTLLIGGGAGGAVDIYGRLVARHTARHLPGSPTIVPRNLPSAGGVQAFMNLGTTAPRDGSTFATSARGPFTDPILSLKPPVYAALGPALHRFIQADAHARQSARMRTEDRGASVGAIIRMRGSFLICNAFTGVS